MWKVIKMIGQGFKTGMSQISVRGPGPLLWAGSRAARLKITVSGTPNCLSLNVIHRIYLCYENVILS